MRKLYYQEQSNDFLKATDKASCRTGTLTEVSWHSMQVYQTAVTPERKEREYNSDGYISKTNMFCCFVSVRGSNENECQVVF